MYLIVPVSSYGHIGIWVTKLSVEARNPYISSWLSLAVQAPEVQGKLSSPAHKLEYSQTL